MVKSDISSVSQIKDSLASGHFETAISSFASVSASGIDLERSQFISVLSNLQHKPRAMFFEGLSAMLPGEHQETFLSQAYSDSHSHIVKIREMLQLNTTSAPNDFFHNRLWEWQTITGLRPQVCNKELLQDQIKKLGTESDKELFDTLRSVAPLYFFRKMLFPSMLNVSRFVEVSKTVARPIRQLNVLEFGCGAADIGIVAMNLGYNTTICDVEGAMLDYALLRVALRKFTATAVASSAVAPIPFNDETYDIIVAVEVLEHLRDPLRFLELAYAHLRRNGLLLLGSFPFNQTTASGDHLPEALELREDLLEYLENQFLPFESDLTGQTLRRN